MRFWGTPELIENLLPFLDPSGTQNLAECHKLTRLILRNGLNWNKLIKRTFPRTSMKHYSVPDSMDSKLESERSKAVSLAKILSMNKDLTSKSQLEMDLLHAICERFSLSCKQDGIYFHTHFVNVSCSCLQTHRVSLWGFLLLEDVAAILDSRPQSILEMASKELDEPLLTALGSRALRQEEMVERITSTIHVTCNSKKSAQALAILAEKTRAWGLGDIHVDKVIGAEGWTSIRKALELLSRKRQLYVKMVSERYAMTAGKKEDMKAIWDLIRVWDVKSDEGSVSYKMSFSNVEGRTDRGWEDWDGVYGSRKGLGSIVQMSHEEWLEEVTNLPW